MITAVNLEEKVALTEHGGPIRTPTVKILNRQATKECVTLNFES